MIKISEEARQRVQKQNFDEAVAREELEKKNFNFLQIQKSSLRDMRRLAKLQPSALEILMLLGERMNRQNAIMISQNTLQEITGLSRASIQRGMATLERERWLQPVKVGSAKAYVVNSRVFWQADGKAKTASFSAQIIASATEQDTPVEQWDSVEMKTFPVLTSREERVVVLDEKLPPPDQGEIELE